MEASDANGAREGHAGLAHFPPFHAYPQPEATSILPAAKEITFKSNKLFDTTCMPAVRQEVTVSNQRDT